MSTVLETRLNPITRKVEWRAYDPDSVDADANAGGYFATHAEGIGETPQEALDDLLEQMA